MLWVILLFEGDVHRRPLCAAPEVSSKSGNWCGFLATKCQPSRINVAGIHDRRRLDLLQLVVHNDTNRPD
jgi:hypothetical protein